MKTILLTLLLSCCGLRAQTPPAATDDATAPATDPGAAAAAPAVPAAPNAPTNNALAPAAPPAFPSLPATPSRRFPRSLQGLSRTNIINPAAKPFPPGNPLSGLVATNGAAGLTNSPPSSSSAAVPPGTPQPAEQIIPAGEINFPKVDVEQVLEVYAMLVDRTVLHAPLPPVQITLKTQTPLTKSEAIQALKSVLAMNQITMLDVGDKFVKAVPVNLAPAQGTPFSSRNLNQLPESDEYITQIVQLKYVKPKDIIPVLAPLANIQNSILPIDDNNMLIIRDYTSNVKRMLELIKQIDVTIPLDFESEVIPIKYAQASDIASALSSLGGGTGTSIGKGSSVGGGGSRTGSGMGGMGGTGGYGAGGMGTGTTPGTFGAGGQTQPGAIGGASAGGSRASSFQDRLSNLVKKAGAQGEFQVLGQTKIIADQRTNSLLVFASKQDMEMIKKIINQLDIVLAQVLIEAIIMEVNLDNSHTLGVSYAQNSLSQPGNYFSGIGAINNGTFLNSSSYLSNVGTNLASAVPSGFSYWANFGNDFQATLTAIANDSRINVLSRPYVQTSHGVPASIQVGQSVPEVTGTYFGGINGAASSQYQQQFVGISLNVTPLINPDGLVVMDINQQVQQLGPNYTIDGNPVPSTTQRNAQATVSVRDRDTIILGGMISSSVNSSHAGVPLLKDIPVLGYLFRSSSVDKQRVELIVLIHPTVLPTPEAAALAATHQRTRLPGIKRAEAEEQRDYNQRLKDAEKIKVPDERE